MKNRFMVLILATCLPMVAFAAETLQRPVTNNFVKGWENHTKQLDMVEYVPKGETVEDWSQMITLQKMHSSSIKGEMLFASMAQGFQEACGSVKPIELGKDDNDNGYSSIMWTLICPLNPQTKKPETVFVKAIEGKEGLHIIQWAYRSIPSKNDAMQVVSYLNKVYVCDNSKAHPCKKTAK